MKNKLKIGVIGCGYWGPNLIRNFHSLDGSTVKAVCDRDMKRLSQMMTLYPGIAGVSDAGSLFADPEIDAIAIATPVHTHFELAKAALLAGKHVFIEKPMASSAAQCQELNVLAQENKCTLMIGHTFIYSDPIRKLKEFIDTGEIGTVYYLSSQRLNLGLYQPDINVAWDLATHDIAIILHLFGAMPVTVSCQGKAHITPGIEDVTILSMEFEDGKFAMVNSSWLDPHKVRQMVIVGSEKMITYDDIEPIEKIKIYDKCVKKPDHYNTYGEFAYAYHYGDVRAPYFKMSEPVRNECQHFLDCINEGTKALSSGKEGQKVVEILEASSESLKNQGRKIALDATCKMRLKSAEKTLPHPTSIFVETKPERT